MTKREIKITPRGTLSRSQIRSVVKAAHVAPRDDEWVVIKAGPRHTRKSFPTKEAALSYARELVTDPEREVIVHSKDVWAQRNAA